MVTGPPSVCDWAQPWPWASQLFCYCMASSCFCMASPCTYIASLDGRINELCVLCSCHLSWRGDRSNGDWAVGVELGGEVDVMLERLEACCFDGGAAVSAGALKLDAPLRFYVSSMLGFLACCYVDPLSSVGVFYRNLFGGGVEVRLAVTVLVDGALLSCFAAGSCGRERLRTTCTLCIITLSRFASAPRNS